MRYGTTNLLILVVAGLFAFASFAEENKEPEKAKAIRKIDIKGYDPSRFHSLVIAIDNYKHWTDLSCAKNDGRAIARTLKKEYAFGDVKLLENDKASREAILTALDSYMSLGAEDSLIIYYAGHGWMDPVTKTGYWVPAEARVDKKFDYVANSQVVEDYFKKYKVKHLLVISDSCFSGTLLRGMGEMREPEWKLPSSFGKPSRWVLTSGDLAPVADDSGGGHSPFASRVLQYLQHSDNPMFGVQDLYVYVRKNLQSQAIAQPMKTPAHMPGGEFIFCRLDASAMSGEKVGNSMSLSSMKDIEIIGAERAVEDTNEYLVKVGGMFSKDVYAKADGGRFVEMDDGKVFDKQFKSSWWMMEWDNAYKWSRAQEICDETSEGSYRLPTVEELQSLITSKKKKGEWARINADFFLEHKRVFRFWTIKKGFGSSMCVDFNMGVIESTKRNETCGILAISNDQASE